MERYRDILNHSTLYVGEGRSVSFLVRRDKMKHVFIIGSKGVPAKYGGFETFVDELVSRQVSKDIKYHVACMSNNISEFQYKTADCFNVKVPSIGPAKAVYYDIAALNYCVNEIKKRKLNGSIVYVLACRIGPFFNHYVKQLHKLNCKVYVNPDGHEWKRAKWNWMIKKYWKLSERLMVKHADLLICDSINIEKYIQADYKKYHPNTTYISYGAEIREVNDEGSLNKLKEWYQQFDIKEKDYYLIVGRFVPENNYELMIKGFMASETKKDLVIITNVEKNKFYKKLLRETGFDKDYRIKFVGTVYDQNLLYLIRKKAFAYIHGHSVGGTNPSLLEALASTDINLLFDVGFNREVAMESAFYWKLRNKELSKLINEIDCLKPYDIEKLKKASRKRITESYTWNQVSMQYEHIFNEINKKSIKGDSL